MPVSAHDVAEQLRQRLPHAGNLKIHALLYYCQAWHVTWTGGPLFPEEIEAWPTGPVVAQLWYDEEQGEERPYVQPLDDEQVAVVDYVLDRYGHYPGEELRLRTRLEEPWRNARMDEDSFGHGTGKIAHKALLAWFSGDAAYAAHAAEVNRLRRRRDVYGFDGPAFGPSLSEATLRVLGYESS